MASTLDIIKTLLEEHGCQYDESVVSQLNEYAFRYMKVIVQNSEEICLANDRQTITTQDLKVTMDLQNNPSAQQFTDFANKKNKQKLSDLEGSNNQNFGNLKLYQIKRNKITCKGYKYDAEAQLLINNILMRVDEEFIKKEEELVIKQQKPQQRIKIEIPNLNQDF